MTNRELGFYWVKDGDEWMIAEWYEWANNKDTLWWGLAGMEDVFHDEDFAEIDEHQIIRPNVKDIMIDECPQKSTSINDIKEIISLGKKTKGKLRLLNDERAYNGRELTKYQLIYQIVFLKDAPNEEKERKL